VSEDGPSSSSSTSERLPSKPGTARSITGANPRPVLKAHRSNGSETHIPTPPSPTTPKRATRVVARVSTHILRLEREFNLSKLVSQSDPDFQHFVRPIELVRLPSRNGHDAIIISIFEAPGENYLRGMVEFGPNAYKGIARKDSWAKLGFSMTKDTRIPLQLFLDFAIGATECCEILHHGNGMVHGELRGDAFHFNHETGSVKMLNFGSGARSFENGLTSAGWYSLSREVGIEHKLQFIAPEQTGRLPAEPDSRTDIFSLGVLFWMMLTGELPREGDTPLIIMQNALSRRIPPVSAKRMDVPEVLSQVIQKMTQKNIDERYNSTSGLKYDLTKIQSMLCSGDMEGLKAYKIGTRDVSAFFNLPSHQIGRLKERQQLVSIIEVVAKRQQKLSAVHGLLPNMSVSSSSERNAFNPVGDDAAVSDSASSRESEKATTANGVPPIPHTHSQESIAESEPSSTEELILNAKHGLDLKSSSSITSNQATTVDSTAQLLRNATKVRRKGRCEVVSISGAAGLGKSCLIQSIQIAARSHGYFAVAKFDQARKSPFEPVLRLMSSLFRQIFSESDVSTEFHTLIRGYVNPVWHVFHTYLDLPQWLLSSSHNGGSGLKPFNDEVSAAPDLRRASSPAISSHSGNTSSSTSGTATDWLRTGGSMKSSRFANIFLGVLRVLASQKFICFAIEDLQFADNESLDLIQKIVGGKVPILLIATYRELATLPKSVKPLIASSTKLQVAPFTEDETAEYVASTLHCETDYIVPLVAVIQEKTAGNPFFIREMLDTCYRKLCVYYSWRNSAWEFDLDRIFLEFESQSYGSQITNDFIAKRLQDLSPASRGLLAWAALLGTSFSFSLVKRLLYGENVWPNAQGVPQIGSQDPVAGLQGALGAYLIMPCENEDRFRFSHDR
jgi:serine/threonine protein kinase